MVKSSNEATTKPPHQFLQKEEQPVEDDNMETWGKEYATLSFKVKSYVDLRRFCELKDSK
ncbi:hypothetical protein KI387_013848, partial [Taxus chinensis]